MTDIDPPADVQARLRRARRRVLLARAVAVSVFVLGIAGTALFTAIGLEAPPLPPSRSTTLSADDNYQVDVVLIDQPKMSLEEVRDTVRPMLDLLMHRWPQQPVHIRLAIYRNGFPYRMSTDSAIAAYVPKEDFFVLDAHASAESYRSTTPVGRGMTPTGWLAFIMGHEAAHNWQALRGDDMNHSSFDKPDVYPSDPVELEAFKEGITQASRAMRRPLALKYNGKKIASDPFWFYALEPKDYELRISRAWTVRGTLLRWRDAVIN